MTDQLEETKAVQVNTVAPAEPSKDLTDVAQFKPLPSMIVWLDTAIQLESDNITEIAAACNLTRQAWYEWLDKPGFIEWFRSCWDKKLSGHAWRLDAIGMKNAKRDFKYWESMQKRVGNLHDSETMGASFKDGEKEVKIIVTRG